MSRLQTTFGLARDVLRRAPGMLNVCCSLLSPIKKKKKPQKNDLQLPRVVASTWSIAGSEAREMWKEFGINCFIRVAEFLCEKQKNKCFFFVFFYARAALCSSCWTRFHFIATLSVTVFGFLFTQIADQPITLHTQTFAFWHADAVRTTYWRPKRAAECGTKKKDSSDFEHGLVVGVAWNNNLKQPLITTKVCRVATPSTLTQYTWTFTGPF